MNRYTVVLLRPDYLADPYGQDVYVAQVTARDAMHALRKSQEEAFASDTKDEMEPDGFSDYALCVMFEGWHEPNLFGWAL